ncbi:carotenoid isomerooxygenase-like [Phlebotomus argentipes]|uniref:carotenoid isomerooxygenase-like n=1 Tax=Phlebotomus argentipes TaxID=94469 RepID=UPI002892AF08|nr:carotenoid isomerooxygenase-like [Phlebotomus argentipes]
MSAKVYPNCDSSVWLRSCEEEILQAIDGKVSGTIPEWIKGSLLRNGPGKGHFGPDKFNHLFDKSALLHRFAIADGKVTYQCRFIRTNCFKENSAANRIVVTEFGTKSTRDPCKSIFEKISAIFNGEGMSDNAMISIYPFGDEFFAFTESPIMFNIDVETLETKERINLSQQFGIVHHTSHPHVRQNGSAFNLGTAVTKFGPKYCIIGFPRSENGVKSGKIVASMPVSSMLNPCYMHTFGMTENFFVLVEQPLFMPVTQMSKAIWNDDPLIDTLCWNGDKTTRFHVLSRTTGNLVQTFCAEAFFFFHMINAFEEDSQIIIDICCYENADIINAMLMENIRNMQTNPNYSKSFQSIPQRFVLPLNTEDEKNLCIPEKLTDLACDLPQINYLRHSGKPYRYFYALSSDFACPGMIIKVDVHSKTRTTWSEEHCFPGEPVFLEAPNPTSEDDGVLLSVLLWGSDQENRVGLLILNARNLEEIARCEFITSSPVPRCVHGWFSATKED